MRFSVVRLCFLDKDWPNCLPKMLRLNKYKNWAICLLSQTIRIPFRWIAQRTVWFWKAYIIGETKGWLTKWVLHFNLVGQMRNMCQQISVSMITIMSWHVRSTHKSPCSIHLQMIRETMPTQKEKHPLNVCREMTQINYREPLSSFKVVWKWVFDFQKNFSKYTSAFYFCDCNAPPRRKSQRFASRVGMLNELRLVTYMNK